jgi:hypothetical protein
MTFPGLNNRRGMFLLRVVTVGDAMVLVRARSVAFEHTHPAGERAHASPVVDPVTYFDTSRLCRR